VTGQRKGMTITGLQPSGKNHEKKRIGEEKKRVRAAVLHGGLPPFGLGDMQKKDWELRLLPRDQTRGQSRDPVRFGPGERKETAPELGETVCQGRLGCICRVKTSET